MDSPQNSDDIGDACETNKNDKSALIAKYNMEHKNRGLALIFNHEYFDNSVDFSRRRGTNVDCEKLITTWKSLGFEVLDYHNKTLSEVRYYLKKAAEIDHTDSDCICICVLSHGEQGYISAKDAQYKTDLLWKYFTEDKCPTLTGKPKLFFIQACQGDRLDCGITLQQNIKTGGDGDPTMNYYTFLDGGVALRKIKTDVDGDPAMNYTIFEPDFLFACSTIPGFYSWRNPTNGSWFIQSLCTEIESRGKVCDILTLLARVCQFVALNFESSHMDPKKNEKKQIPCINSMLTKMLIFK